MNAIMLRGMRSQDRTVPIWQASCTKSHVEHSDSYIESERHDT